MTATSARRRAGFTLVELMVAISLAILITSLAVVVANSGAIDSQRTVSAADRVSGWLITAKNRAKRDGRPRGVRFYRQSNVATDPANNYFDTAQYIEQPEAYVPNPTHSSTGPRIVFVYTRDTDDGSLPPHTNIVNNRKVYFASPTAAEVTEFQARIGKNSFLIVPELGLASLIVSDPSTTATTTLTQPVPGGTAITLTACELTLKSYPDLGAGFTTSLASSNVSPNGATLFTYSYGFQSSSQGLFGEPVLQIGGEVVVDARRANTTPDPDELSTLLGVDINSIPTTTALPDLDIMFSPSGEVLNTTSGLIALWQRNPNMGTGPYDFANAGEQILTVIYTKTGAIATQPVTQNVSDPFRAAKDGINAGF